jgi:hypothetical protein
MACSHGLDGCIICDKDYALTLEADLRSAEAAMVYALDLIKNGFVSEAANEIDRAIAERKGRRAAAL